jgi:hypothetical protein
MRHSRISRNTKKSRRNKHAGNLFDRGKKAYDDDASNSARNFVDSGKKAYDEASNSARNFVDSGVRAAHRTPKDVSSGVRKLTNTASNYFKYRKPIIKDPNINPVSNFLNRGVRSGVNNAASAVNNAASAVNDAASVYKTTFLPKAKEPYDYDNDERDFGGGRRTRKRGQKSKKRRQR